jgi:hypothetical protein
MSTEKEELMQLKAFLDRRNDLLDEIIETVNRRETTHISELISEIRTLCLKLEDTVLK